MRSCVFMRIHKYAHELALCTLLSLPSCHFLSFPLIILYSCILLLFFFFFSSFGTWLLLMLFLSIRVRIHCSLGHLKNRKK